MAKSNPNRLVMTDRKRPKAGITSIGKVVFAGYILVSIVRLWKTGTPFLIWTSQHWAVVSGNSQRPTCPSGWQGLEPGQCRRRGR